MDGEIIASVLLKLPNVYDKAFKIKQDTIKVFSPITYDELSCLISNLQKFD